MSEETEFFKAYVGEISGLGKLADEIGAATLVSKSYFDTHAVPLGQWDNGILSWLRQPFSDIGDEWRNRHVRLSNKCTEVGAELNIAAWLYLDQEKKNYDALNANTQVPVIFKPGYGTGDAFTPATGVVDQYEGSEDYGRPDGIDYPPPIQLPDDVAQVVADAAGWLDDVDKIIEQVTGRSPLRELTDPLGGNWNDLRRLGDAYRIAGEAMEKGGNALERGNIRVADHWDGRAAIAYDEYAAKLVEAMRWEGSCGRVIAAVADRAAEQIRDGVHLVVTTLRERFEAQVDVSDPTKVFDFIAKKVPIAGMTYQAFVIFDLVRNTIDLCARIVDEIRTLTDLFREFLALVTDPGGEMNAFFEEKVSPVVKLAENVNLALDVTRTADAGPVYELPQDAYDLGQGSEPWADA